MYDDEEFIYVSYLTLQINGLFNSLMMTGTFYFLYNSVLEEECLCSIQNTNFNITFGLFY